MFQLSHKKTRSSWLFALVLILSLLSSAIASPLLIARQDDSSSDSTSNSTPGSGLTTQGIILAVILFLGGLLFLFAGFHNFRLTMFLVGFYAWATIAWIILANAEPSGTYGSARLTIYLVVPIVVGFIAGLFLACCFHLGLWLLGAYGGFLLGLWILSWKSGGVIEPRWGQGLLMGLLALAGFLLTFFAEFWAIIFFTSFIGAYSIILGLDIFLNTGFSLAPQAFLDSHHNITYTTNARDYGMLAGVIGLAIFGMIVQFIIARRVLGPRQPWTQKYGYAGRYYNNSAVKPATKRWGLF